MSLNRWKWVGVILFGGFLLTVIIPRYMPVRDRAIREKFVVGTWQNAGFEFAHQPINLHIYADQTYWAETSNYHIRYKGTWMISNSQDRGRLILDAYHIGTDTHSDCKLTLDLAGQTLTDPYGTQFLDHQYVKTSDKPEATITDPEKFVLGAWTNNGKWGGKAHRFYFFSSNHHFNVDFDSEGTWRMEGSGVVLDWIDEEVGKPRSAIVRVNRDKGTMIEPYGPTLTRINRSY